MTDSQTDPFKDIEVFYGYVHTSTADGSTGRVRGPFLRQSDIDAAHAALLAQHRDEIAQLREDNTLAIAEQNAAVERAERAEAALQRMTEALGDIGMEMHACASTTSPGGLREMIQRWRDTVLPSTPSGDSKMTEQDFKNTLDRLNEPDPPPDVDPAKIMVCRGCKKAVRWTGMYGDWCAECKPRTL